MPPERTQHAKWAHAGACILTQPRNDYMYSDFFEYILGNTYILANDYIFERLKLRGGIAVTIIYDLWYCRA